MLCSLFTVQFQFGGDSQKGPVVSAQEAQAHAILQQAKVRKEDSLVACCGNADMATERSRHRVKRWKVWQELWQKSMKYEVINVCDKT